MPKLLRAIVIWLLCICAVGVIYAPAQTFTTLLTFNGQNGANPDYVSLFQGTDGNLYGTAEAGGATANCSGGCGTVFNISTAGSLTVLHDFCSASECNSDGEFPKAGVIQSLDGNYYGTTWGSSVTGFGSVFQMTSAGTLTTLYTFCSLANCADGYWPTAPLVQGTDGNFYGTTTSGGTGYENSGGTIFKITSTGALTTLYSFCSQTNCTDGMNPLGGLVQASDGNFYGTTNQGGTNSVCDGGCGTVFRITPAGALTTLYNFCSKKNCTDGTNPMAGVIQATNGDLYGTTFGGGKNGSGAIFKISLSGKFSVFYSFCAESSCSDGETPYAPVLQASDGNFYGTTNYGGVSGNGVIFEITSAKKLTVLYNFDSDNFGPVSPLMQDTNGTFYGTTFNGGANVDCLNSGGCGTVYSLSEGLGPFVKTEPSFGTVGSTVIIIGTNLTGTTAVNFDATAATFQVVSSSEITATVPSKAKTGIVSVTTPSGTLKTLVDFKVTPIITTFTPESGPVGTEVTITGTGLTGATEVTFGGVKATTFKVISGGEVTADVPTGAETGVIAITTAGGTATSSQTFTVTE